MKEEKPLDLFEEKTTVVEVTVNEDVPLNDFDEKIKSIDELLKDTTDDDFYSLVDTAAVLRPAAGDLAGMISAGVADGQDAAALHLNNMTRGAFACQSAVKVIAVEVDDDLLAVGYLHRARAVCVERL